MTFFKKYWWKITGIILVVLTLTAGLLIPLGPGISRVSPENINTDTIVEVLITGYNTHFTKKEKSLQFWLKNGRNVICSESVSAVDNSHAIASFYIPEKLASRSFHVVMNNDFDGTYILTDAIRAEQEVSDTGMVADQKCTIGIANDKAAFFNFPYRELLHETIRNIFFHVAFMFGMMLLLLVSMIFSIRYLAGFKIRNDIIANRMANVGIFMGVIGLLTGMVWAKFTWGSWWVSDPKLNGTAVGLLAYFAYLILRNSMDDDQRRARIAAVYNIFAFVILMVFIMILPRLTDSLHPGNGGNPAFSEYDMDNTMRMFFYPAIIGWTLIGAWIAGCLIRMDIIKSKIEEL